MFHILINFDVPKYQTNKLIENELFRIFYHSIFAISLSKRWVYVHAVSPLETIIFDLKYFRSLKITFSTRLLDINFGNLRVIHYFPQYLYTGLYCTYNRPVPPMLNEHHAPFQGAIKL